MLDNSVMTIVVGNVDDEQIDEILNNPPFVDPEYMFWVLAGINSSDTVRVQVFRGEQSDMVLRVNVPMTSDSVAIEEAKTNIMGFCEKMSEEGHDVLVSFHIPEHIKGTEFEKLARKLFF